MLMTVSRPVLALAMASAVLAGSWLANQGPTRAQEGPPSFRNVGVGKARAHIADAMLLPARLPFPKETSLEEVAAYLRKELQANVVLDLAALDRRDLKPSAKVRLDLADVRLKTGLKLLLDQVGLTTKVIAEDNLLIFTDKSEAEEPIGRVLDEVKSLHRDVHSLQDEVRDLRALMEAPVEEEPVARMRNPTIIEEMPADGEAGKADAKKPKEKGHEGPSRTRPGA